jgi:hypothetical protein
LEIYVMDRDLVAALITRLESVSERTLYVSMGEESYDVSGDKNLLRAAAAPAASCCVALLQLHFASNMHRGQLRDLKCYFTDR